MSFECINESSGIHYVGTQPSRGRKAPTGRQVEVWRYRMSRGLRSSCRSSPRSCCVVAARPLRALWGWATDAPSPSSGSQAILPKTCRETGALK